MAAPLPKTLISGPLTYTVSEDASKFLEQVHEQKFISWGTTTPRTLEIIVQPALPVGQKRRVLLHEALHVAFEMGDNQQDYDEEEKIVSSLALPLLGILRDNPDLVDYLTEDDEEESTDGAYLR